MFKKSALIMVLATVVLSASQGYSGGISMPASGNDEERTAICKAQYQTCTDLCPDGPAIARLVCFQRCSNEHTHCLNLLRVEYGLDPFPIPYPGV